MKKLMSLILVSATMLCAGAVFAADVANAAELHTTPGQCNAFETEVAVWSWDAQTSRFVLEGYTCKKQGGR